MERQAGLFTHCFVAQRIEAKDDRVMEAKDDPIMEAKGDRVIVAKDDPIIDGRVL
jgi:hypothetical protein